MLNRLILIFLVLVICSSCESEKETDNRNALDVKESAAHNLDWLIGDWIDSATFKGREVFLENWKKETEQLYSGSKFSVKRGDTLSPSQITITKTDGKYYYSYSVDKEQVTFVQDSISDNFISFRNTTNIFPDELIYRYEKDTLVISFSGITNGFKQGSSFKAIKVK